MYRLMLIVLVVFVAALSEQKSTRAEPRVALVIGNSDYQLVSPLANPENDAILMASTLSEPGFDVTLKTDLTQKAMKRAIRDFGLRLRQSGGEAVGLFYFAGHGVQAYGRNYLIPLGGPIRDESDLDIETINANGVLRQMESAGNAVNIPILDACRNNPFRRLFRSSNNGLGRMEAPRGSLIAFSADHETMRSGSRSMGQFRSGSEGTPDQSCPPRLQSSLASTHWRRRVEPPPFVSPILLTHVRRPPSGSANRTVRNWISTNSYGNVP